MGVTKIEYIRTKKLPPETREKYNLKDNEFAKITVTNPVGGLDAIGVQSAIKEIRKAFKKKELENFEL